MKINETVKLVHKNAKAKGWWNEERNFGELLMLIISEASEALEEYRNGGEITEVYYSGELPEVCSNFPENEIGKLRLKNAVISKTPFIEEVESMGPGKVTYNITKPEGVPTELADIVIRVMDICGRYGIDLEKAISEKIEYNKTRPERHGNKKC